MSNMNFTDLNQEPPANSQANDYKSSINVYSGFNFLPELFDHPPLENELSHSKCFLNTEYQKMVEDQMHDDLNPINDNLKLCRIKKKKNSRKKYAPLLAKLSKENNELKRANQQLKKIINTQERSIANYEVKMAQYMTDLLAAKKELEKAKVTKDCYEMGNTNLKCHINQIEGELSQCRNDEKNKKIQELEKIISIKIERIRRLKKNSTAYRLQLAKKDALLKKLQHHNRQILGLLLEFGYKLKGTGLLTKDVTIDVLQKYEEEYFTLKASENIDVKNLYKNSNAITTLSGEYISQSCRRELSSICTNVSTSNQNKNFSLLSSMPSFQLKDEEVNSNNIVSAVPLQNELINNTSTKQEIFKKKLSLSSLADDTGQDKFYEFLPETINHEKETIDPGKQRKVKSILPQKQNFCVNQEEKVFRTAEISSCNNILIPLSKSEIPVKEEKIKSCIEQTSSVSISTEKEFLPAMSMPLVENVKQCPVTKLQKQITNESNVSDTLIQKTKLENEISTFETMTKNLELESDVEKTTFFHDEQSLLDNESNEFSKFENLLSILLNPISPLPQSPIKNNKSFNNESILSRNIEEIGEYPQICQLSSITKSVKDQPLVVEKYQNLSCSQNYTFQSDNSVSPRSVVFESHKDLELYINPKLVEQCNSLDGNIVNPLVCEKRVVTSNAILYPKLRKCYVSLSRCDITKYFSSLRKQISSQMLDYNQSSCKNFIPESSNSISSCKTNYLVSNERKYKTAANANKMPDSYDSFQHKAEVEGGILSREFPVDNLAYEFQHDVSMKRPFIDSTKVTTEHSLFNVNTSFNSIAKDSSVDAVLGCKFSSNHHCDLTESENSPVSSLSPEFTLDDSLSNASRFSTNPKSSLSWPSVNVQNCFVLVSRSDISNYLHSLKKKSLFQANECNQIKYDGLNSSISKFNMLSNLEQTEKLVANHNVCTSVPISCGIKSDYMNRQCKKTETKSKVRMQTFSENQSNVICGHEASAEKHFSAFNVENMASHKEQLLDNINTLVCTKDYNKYPENENSHESDCSNINIDEASPSDTIECSKSRKQDKGNKSIISQTHKCYVSLSKSNVPNYFCNLQSQTPSQIVDYYNIHLTNSSLKNPNSVHLLERKDNNSVLHEDCLLSTQRKFSDNMQHEIEKNNYTSDSEIFLKDESNSYGDFLEKATNLSKVKAAVPFASSQYVVTPSNTVIKDFSLNTNLDSLCLAENFCLTECENYDKSSKRLENISKDICLSNRMTPSEREKEITNKFLSGNLQKCYVSLSKNDIPNYFLSLRRKPMFPTTKDRQTTTKSAMNYSNITTFLDMNCETNGNCNSVHHEINEIGIDSSTIRNDPRNESKSFITHEDFSDKSSNLLNGKTLAVANENDKLVSCFSIAENSFKSQCLPSKNSSIPLFEDNDTCDGIKSVNEKFDGQLSQSLSAAEICLKDISAVPVQHPINNLNTNLLKSFKPQNCSLLKSYAPLSDADKSVRGVKPVNKKLLEPVSQNSSTHPVEQPLNNFNQNSISSSRSKNHSLTVADFRNSSDTETFHENLSPESVKFPIKNEHKKYSLKRKRSKSSDCNFSEKTSLAKCRNDFIDSKPLFKKRRTLLLPGPSVPTKWKKSLILNKKKLPSERKTQTKVHIPTSLTPEFWKKCSAVIEKNSLKKKIKPLDNGVTWVAPVRLRGRTSKSKAFIKISCNKHIDNDGDVNTLPNKEVEFSLIPPTREENIENYTSVKPSKIRKQCKKKTSNQDPILSNVSEESLNLFEQPVFSQKENQLDKKHIPGHPKPNTSAKIFDILQKYTSKKHASCKKIINKQLSFNKTKNKLKDERTVETSLDNKNVNSGINSKLTKHKIEQSKELIDRQLSGNENVNQIKNEMPEASSHNTDVLNKSFICTSFGKREKLGEGNVKHFQLMELETSIDVKSYNNVVDCNEDFSCRTKTFSNSVVNCSFSDNFMNNSFSNISHNANKICLNSLEQPIPSRADLQVSRVKPALEHLQHSKKITATNVFFDFLHKQNSKKHQIDHIKEFIDKQLSTNKTEGELKYESKRQSINVTKSKIKNKCKKLSVNETKGKLQIECKKLVDKKRENKLKNESRSLSTNKTKSKAKNRRKKRFNRKLYSKKETEKLECNEEVNPIASPVCDILHGIENIQIADEQFKQYIHSLTVFLINPLHTTDIANLIYHVTNFLHLTRENYLTNSSKKDSACCFLTSAETCIVEALFSIQNDSNLNMQCLTKTILHILHQLILTKVKFHIYGLASLCRVLAEICKRNDDREEALSLCCNILKVKHPFGPYLIASIVAVWKELFMISDTMSEEEILLLRSISFCAQKKPERLSKSNWNLSIELLTELVPSVPDAYKAIELLKNRILIKCLEK
ncbi:unnamed protein product [Larinioides sclopetarius]|uniref:Uncharacterized protein n=1 Tax=Larinioides sclopetarius TaxID=280406 RepID=A0AAV1Z775_9ARAC